MCCWQVALLHFHQLPPHTTTSTSTPPRPQGTLLCAFPGGHQTLQTHTANTAHEANWTLCITLIAHLTRRHILHTFHTKPAHFSLPETNQLRVCCTQSQNLEQWPDTSAHSMETLAHCTLGRAVSTQRRNTCTQKRGQPVQQASSSADHTLHTTKNTSLSTNGYKLKRE